MDFSIIARVDANCLSEPWKKDTDWQCMYSKDLVFTVIRSPFFKSLYSSPLSLCLWESSQLKSMEICHVVILWMSSNGLLDITVCDTLSRIYPQIYICHKKYRNYIYQNIYYINIISTIYTKYIYKQLQFNISFNNCFIFYSKLFQINKKS